MRIKPKNPKVQRIRRIAVGAVALCAVLFILLRNQDTGLHLEDDESALPPETATTAVPEEFSIPGEIDWEYPPGWIDYSDLPPVEELGDEDRPGLGNWRYLLVNGLDQSNYLRESYYPDMTYVEAGYSFQTRAVADLKDFIAAARAEGYIVSISRTFFSYSDQRVRFNGMASTLYDRGGVTLAEAEKIVTERGYYPGADEHQTGLAVNFVDENGDAKFATPVLEWMREHCAEYGFILRYPEGREAYTGREAEPGHFRYVGQLAAEYIMRKGITLEEFKAAYEEGANEIVAW
jgi:D-alanyl-D-alanine carboxypeptidase